MELNSQFAIAHYNKACAYSLQNNKESSIDELSKAIAIDPEESHRLASSDEDFDNIKESAEFKQLIN